MIKQTVRNGKIDFLKFLFSLCIVLNHAKFILPESSKGIFSGFSLSVEFFFLVSGCLMMKTIEKAELNSTLSLGKETGRFMLRKYKSLYPEMAVAYFFAVIIACVFNSANFFTLIQKSWFDAFLLNSTGMRGTAVISVTWYVSSMLICMAFLYPLIRKHKDMALNIILPLGVLLIFGFMYKNYGAIRDPLNWNGFTYRGNLRAMAELSLGCICYMLSKKLGKIEFNSIGKALLALIEFSGYGIFVLYMATGTDGLRDFFYIFILCISVIISFSGKSLGHGLFNNGFFTFLGKFSLPLYLIHSTISIRLFDIIPEAESLRARYVLIVYIALSVVAAFIIMLLSELIRKTGPKIISATKKKITITPEAEKEA